MQRRDFFKTALAATLGTVSLAAAALPPRGPQHHPAPYGRRPAPPPPRRTHPPVRRGRDGYWYAPDGHRVYRDANGVWRYRRNGRRMTW